MFAWALVSQYERGIFRLSAASMCALLVTIVVIALREAHRTLNLMQMSNNCKVIAMAFHEYHEVYGTFPPVAIYDKRGQPKHSWRSLIEPQFARLGAPSYRSNYQMSEPWNSSKNLAAAKDHPFHHHPYSFFAIVGPNASWLSDGMRSRNDFHDGLSGTILVLAVKDAGVGWHEPRDLEFDGERIWLTVNGKQQEVSPANGFVIFGDGSVRYLPETMTAKRMKPYITIDAADKTDDIW